MEHVSASLSLSLSKEKGHLLWRINFQGRMKDCFDGWAIYYFRAI